METVKLLDNYIEAVTRAKTSNEKQILASLIISKLPKLDDFIVQVESEYALGMQTSDMKKTDTREALASSEVGKNKKKALSCKENCLKALIVLQMFTTK